MIEIKGLSKRFGRKIVLDAVHISFERGKVYGIVGKNGAGKTTLFQCLSGLETYEGGISFDFEHLKDHLGFLMTEPFFFPKITGREYIQLLSNARGVPQPNIEEKNVFDLPLDEYASTYSTGMKKKLALTAILLQRNEVFVLDEPFNGVDIQSNLLIVEIIRELKVLKKTVIISSHIFSALAETCDEIVVLEKGKIEKRLGRNSFGDFESEMKKEIVHHRIKSLGLE